MASQLPSLNTVRAMIAAAAAAAVAVAAATTTTTTNLILYKIQEKI